MGDKKKILILVTLFVFMISIGAFQFSKSGSPTAAAAPTEVTVAKNDNATAIDADASQGSDPEKSVTTKNAEGAPEKTDPNEEKVDPALVVAAQLSPRDPFDGHKWDKSKAPVPTPAPAAPQQRTQPYRQPRGGVGGGYTPFNVPTISGVLPEAGGPAAPAGKMPSIDDFPYSVSGTMMGDKPLVVLTDQAGKQKIVSVGGAIDGDSQVVSISNGKVTVRHRGKNKTVSVGGMTPSNNKQEGN